jgi:hypothetical protein
LNTAELLLQTNGFSINKYSFYLTDNLGNSLLYSSFGIIKRLFVIICDKVPGCEKRRTDQSGDPWRKPMPSGGRRVADDDDDGDGDGNEKYYRNRILLTKMEVNNEELSATTTFCCYVICDMLI